MRRIVFSILASLLVVITGFAKVIIKVTNPIALDRKSEMVEIKVTDLKVDFKKNSYILKNATGQEVPYQLIFGMHKIVRLLIFQADVKGNESTVYTFVKGKPSTVKAKTFGRFVPERKDDFAWENDMAAYRMYGPALANENPSNGVDFWSKATSDLVINQRYRDDIYNNISYHIDHGFGLDFYKVAHTMGCGGIAPYAFDSLWIGNHFNTYKVYENGPLRTRFSLVYDTVMVGKQIYKEVLTITIDAGSLLNKANVKFIGKNQKIQLAEGIFLHGGKGNLKYNVANGTMAYAEDAISDAGVPEGRNYVGVFVPSKVTKSMEKDDHSLLITPYETGKQFSYYFGGGWSRWHFPTDNDWFNALSNFAQFKHHPLKISIQ